MKESPRTADLGRLALTWLVPTLVSESNTLEGLYGRTFWLFEIEGNKLVSGRRSETDSSVGTTQLWEAMSVLSCISEGEGGKEGGPFSKTSAYGSDVSVQRSCGYRDDDETHV